MASIKVPSNVTSITFATSGVKAPTAQVISGLTASEVTRMSKNAPGADLRGVARLVSSAVNGDLVIAVPDIITSITIGGVVYAVGGAVLGFGKCLTDPVPAAEASKVLSENFSLVIG